MPDSMRSAFNLEGNRNALRLAREAGFEHPLMDRFDEALSAIERLQSALEAFLDTVRWANCPYCEVDFDLQATRREMLDAAHEDDCPVVVYRDLLEALPLPAAVAGGSDG